MSRRHAAAALVVMALAACTSSTNQGPPPVVLTGNWGYAGTQTVPTSATLAGTLVVSSQAGHTFNGSFAATESGFGIPTTSITGTVYGTAINATTLDFNITVNGVVRRHTGLIRGDSLTGNWAVDNDPAAGSGSYRMRHLSTP